MPRRIRSRRVRRSGGSMRSTFLRNWAKKYPKTAKKYGLKMKGGFVFSLAAIGSAIAAAVSAAAPAVATGAATAAAGYATTKILKQAGGRRRIRRRRLH